MMDGLVKDDGGLGSKAGLSPTFEGFNIWSTSTSTILFELLAVKLPPSTWIFILWPLLVILMVLFNDLLEGNVLEVLVDFSSPPELVPSDWESDESGKNNEELLRTCSSVGSSYMKLENLNSIICELDPSLICTLSYLIDVQHLITVQAHPFLMKSCM